MAKKYTFEEKYNYHQSRVRSCARYGLKFGDPKHSYSDGFVDGVNFRNNAHSTTREFGKASGKAYTLGYNRAQNEIKKHVKKHGVFAGF